MTVWRFPLTPLAEEKARKVRRSTPTAETFPRGLSQPADGFRFAVDSLLLSAFADPSGVQRVIDLGCGCGVVGFGAVLRPQSAIDQVVGLDKDPAMIKAARDNAVALGLEEICLFDQAAMADHKEKAVYAPESFDLALCNPPYRLPGRGRRSTNERDSALVESDGGLDDFLDAAAYYVRNKASAAFVFDAGRLPELMSGLSARRLEPKRLRCVHGRADSLAKVVLVEARKNGGPGLTVEPPLVLYETKQGAPTRSALEFCPYIGCNPQR